MTSAAEWIADLRRLRGIVDTDAPPWKNTHLYPDMQRAIERVQRAIRTRETVAIFGDYDCDGVTSTAQLVRMFRRHGVEPLVRLPHRIHDGYGIQPQHCDAFAAQHVTLLLTADTGIAAHEAITAAQKKGIDVIILDHHHFHTVPDAYAIVHPALAPHHPLPYPSAAGVVHAFIHAFEGGNPWTDASIDLVLAALGTVADLVPLQGGNRHLVQAGLDAIYRLPQGPLQAFLERTCGDGTITSMDLGWKVAPRINAAGRMDDATEALTALLEGGSPLERLETLNNQRQQETLDAVEHAMLSLESELSLPSFICLASSAYGHGIIGLIAGKLTERYNRPTLAASIHGDTCTASLRSPPSYNVVEALERAKDLLTRFGGHAQAAGATFPLSAFIPLTTRLQQDATSHLGEVIPAPVLAIDGVLHPQAIDQTLHTFIQDLAPFGQGNPEPILMLSDVQLERVRRVGAQNNHLQARGHGLPLIGFGLGHLAEAVTHSVVDIACRIGMNTWNGKTEMQMQVVDIRQSSLVGSVV